MGSVRGSFFGKNTLKLIDTYFFFQILSKLAYILYITPSSSSIYGFASFGPKTCRRATFPERPPQKFKEFNGGQRGVGGHANDVRGSKDHEHLAEHLTDGSRSMNFDRTGCIRSGS